MKAFDRAVLGAIYRLHGYQPYGLTIWKEVQRENSERVWWSRFWFVSLGRVYAAIDRLELAGLVYTWLADPTMVRGNLAKRYAELEYGGVAVIRIMERQQRDREAGS